MAIEPLLERVRARMSEKRFDMVDAKTALLRLPEPASASSLAHVEEKLGVSLPPVLREVYMTIANGGFGPGYGLLGGPGGHADEETGDLVGTYRWASEGFIWPKSMVPIVDWGCLILSCVDCSDPRGEMVSVQLETGALARTGRSFEAWLGGWADGEKLFETMHEPGELIDVTNRYTNVTKQIRLPGPFRGESSVLKRPSIIAAVFQKLFA